VIIGGILVSIVFAWLLGNTVWRHVMGEADQNIRLIDLPLSLGTGLAITSSILFFWMILFNGDVQHYIKAEMIMVFALTLLKIKKKYKSSSISSNIPSIDEPTDEEAKELKGTTKLFWAIFLLALVTLIMSSFMFPHGRWDAWSIWNMKARFFIRGGLDWTRAFSESLGFTHPDYPLNLPMTVMRHWLYAFSETIAGPMSTGILFSALIILLLFRAVSLIRSFTAGLIATSVLLGTPYFLLESVSQYADVPLAFYFLATLVLISMFFHFGNTRMLVMAGMSAGFAAWTKNEGMLYAVIVTVFLTAAIYRRRHNISMIAPLSRYFAGLLTGIMPVIVLKLFFATPNDLMSGIAQSSINCLFDIENYQLIGNYMLQCALKFGDWREIAYGAYNPLPIMSFYSLYAGVELKKNENWLMPAVIIGMLAGYFLVYVTSPFDILWHLNTSCTRLFLQLWPSSIFAFFILTAPADHWQKEQ